jgi:hypothetical protein
VKLLPQWRRMWKTKLGSCERSQNNSVVTIVLVMNVRHKDSRQKNTSNTRRDWHCGNTVCWSKQKKKEKENRYRKRIIMIMVIVRFLDYLTPYYARCQWHKKIAWMMCK